MLLLLLLVSTVSADTEGSFVFENEITIYLGKSMCINLYVTTENFSIKKYLLKNNNVISFCESEYCDMKDFNYASTYNYKLHMVNMKNGTVFGHYAFDDHNCSKNILTVYMILLCILAFVVSSVFYSSVVICYYRIKEKLKERSLNKSIEEMNENVQNLVMQA